MEIKKALKKFWDTHVAGNMPPELDDERNYGLTIDHIARKTTHHPEAIQETLKNLEALGLPKERIYDERRLQETLAHYQKACEREDRLKHLTA